MKLDKESYDRLIRGFEWSERVPEIPFLFDNLPEPPCKILDIGCCENVLPFVLKEKGYDSWAIDKRPYEHQYDQFQEADARDLPFEDNSFDAVCAISTIEHIGLVNTPYKTDSDYDAYGDIEAFHEMVRVIKHNGTIIVTVPYGKGHEGLSHWIKFYNSDRLNLLKQNTNFKLDKLSFTKCVNDEWTNIKQDEAENIESEENKVLCNLCMTGHKL